MTVSSPSSFIPALEADYRQLSNESRRSEGFVGLFASADHPEIKEAAERADLFLPLQLATDTRSPRLAAHGLATAQRLVANGAASAADGEALAGMLAVAARLTDETVRLRALQAALTLAQSPVHPATEQGLGAVLGAVLGLLGGKGNRDVVTSTAAATARQVLVLLLGYPEKGDTRAAAVRAMADICAMAAGQSPSWLKIHSLPRTQVLNLLEFVTCAAPEPFQTVPELGEIVGKTMPDMLRPQLQDHFDAGVAALGFATSQFSSLRAALGCTRCLLSIFHVQLASEAGPLLKSLLAGLQGGHPEFQRVAVMHVVVHLLGDEAFLTWLVTTFDCSKGQMLEAGRSLVEACLTALEEAGKRGHSLEDEPPAAAVALALAGTPGSLEPDPAAAAVAGQRGALGALATRGLGAMASSLEAMAGRQTGPGNESVLDASNGVSGTAIAGASATAAKHLVKGIERSLLRVLRAWLAPSPPPEPLQQELIQVLSSCTVAAGKAGCASARDAFLSLLCALSGGPGAGGAAQLPPAADPGPGHCELAATRAVLGVAHRLRGALDGAWPTVLATLVHAERRLAAARAAGAAAVRGGGGGGGGGGDPSPGAGSHGADLDALASSLTALYGSSAAWPLHAVQGLVAGLCDASLEELVGRDRGTGPARAEGFAPRLDAHVGAAGSPPHAAAAASHAAAHAAAAAAAATLGPPAPTRPVALGRLADVLLANAGRLEELWALFLGHVLEVRARGTPPARIAAVEALGTVIVGTLSRPAGPGPDAALHELGTGSSDGVGELAVGPGFGNEMQDLVLDADGTSSSTALPPAPPPPPTDGDRSEGLEQMLLAALESVHGDEREPEVRRAALRVLLSVLRRCGERLGGGWAAALRLLARVPDDGDDGALDLGFQAVQLVAGDYASALPAAALRRCLEVAAAYGAQQADLNVSLTTISLFWNVADVVGRAAPLPSGAEAEAWSGPGSEAADGAGASDVSAAAPGSPGLTARLTSAEATAVLELIFATLQSLASDPRPEVRNSGLRTLFALVSTQGSRLAPARWEACLWETLFPLLRHAVRMSATSSREERGPAALGTLAGGETVTLVVHHSANSDAKQWDETVALALAGMARLFRSHLPRVLASAAGPAGWDELMAVVEGCIAGARKRVALAAAATLATLLAAHGGEPSALGDAAWLRALRSLSVVVEAVATPGCRVPLAVRLETVALIKAAAIAARARGDAKAGAQALRWLERAARVPWSDDDAATGTAPQGFGLPPVQRAALAALGELAPDPGELDLWVERLGVLTRLLSPHQILEAATERRRALAQAGEGADVAADACLALGAGGQGSMRLASREGSTLRADAVRDGTPALSSRFLDTVMNSLAKAYSNAPAQVQTRALPDVAAALGACMLVRYSIPEDDIWRTAGGVFVALVPLGLEALAQQAPDAELEDRTWQALGDAFEGFLLAGSAPNSTDSPVGNDSGTPTEPGHITPRTMSTPEAHPHQTSYLVPIAGGAESRQDSLGSALAQESEAQPELSQTLSDDELEVLVLDILADSVLGLAGAMSKPALARFVSIIDRGVCRGARQRPGVLGQLHGAGGGPSVDGATGLAYSQACLRKLFVLAARCDVEPAESFDSARQPSPLLPAAGAALRALLARCTDMLTAAGSGGGRGGAARYNGPGGRPRLDEALCMLDVLAALSLAPEVVDAAATDAPPGVAGALALARANAAGTTPGTKERTHLLLVYPTLAAAVALPELGLRERVRELLCVVGELLGIAEPRGE